MLPNLEISTPQQNGRAPMDLPFVSVIMPVRNEAVYITGSLRSVLDQDYPAERMEIIVADGLSTDGTREVVHAFQRFYPNIFLIDNPGKIVPTGLNAALQVAKGSVIVRVDGHCEIASDYLANCVGHLENDLVDCVGGPMETIGETYCAQAIAIAMSSTFGVGDSAFRVERKRKMLVDSVAFPAYRRKTIDLTGPFDEEMVRNQDDEYNYRIRKMGGKVLLTPDIRSRYYSRSSLSSLWRQYFQYGYWKVRVMQKHPYQMRRRQFVPPLFIFALFISLILALTLRHGWIFLIVLVGSYLIANIYVSTTQASKRGWKYFPLLIIVYAIIHISYGLGFIVGLIKFANRWEVRKIKPASS